MSNTPRTDKQAFRLPYGWDDSCADLGSDEVVPAYFARELETELNELKKKHMPPISIYDLVLGYIREADRELEFPEVVYQVINQNPHRTDLRDFTIKEAIWSLLDDNKLQLTPERSVRVYKK